MVNQKQGAPDASGAEDTTAEQGVDPRDAEHATGTQQAAENDATESPS